ncbi:MAG: serine hydrolase [Gemmatimonadota bacterium]
MGMGVEVGKRRWALLLFIGLAACSEPSGPSALEGGMLSEPWPVGSAAAHGFDAVGLEAALAAGQGIARLQSLLVVRHGVIVAERYYRGGARDVRADVRSVTKSIVSTLVGIALARGDLPSLDLTLGQVMPAELEGREPEKAGITIRDLLTMSSGFQWHEVGADGYSDWITSGRPVEYLLDQPLVAEPGAEFEYNSAAVHVLGVVLERVLGRDLDSYAREVLFTPLGITAAVWEPFADGTVNGGSGLDLLPRDVAKVAQLALQNGWTGTEQLTEPAWFQEASAPHFAWRARVASMPSVSYGYLWWVSDTPGAFFAWGYGGQFAYVVPGRDLVVVATSEWRAAGAAPSEVERAVLDLIVQKVVPTAR